MNSCGSRWIVFLVGVKILLLNCHCVYSIDVNFIALNRRSCNLERVFVIHRRVLENVTVCYPCVLIEYSTVTAGRWAVGGDFQPTLFYWSSRFLKACKNSQIQVKIRKLRSICRFSGFFRFQVFRVRFILSYCR